MSHGALSEKDDFTLYHSQFFLALILLFLGTFVNRETLDLAKNLGDVSFRLLNLFRGVQLPATLTTFIIARVAVFFLLWGFLKTFKQLGRSKGGIIGALLLSLHPFVTSTGGQPGIFMVTLALFWWIAVFSHSYFPQKGKGGQSGWFAFFSFMNAPGCFLPLLIVIVGSIVLSPWMLVLACLVLLLNPRNIWPSQSLRLGIGVGLLIFVIIAIGILELSVLEDWRGEILAKGKLSWLKHFLNFGQSLDAIYLWGALLLFCFGVGILSFVYPEIIILLLVSISLVLGIIGLDLAGLLFLWVVLCSLVGLAFEISWHYLVRFNKILLPNLLALILTITLFHLCREEPIYGLIEAQKVYRADFQHQCGEYILQPAISEEKIFMVDPDNSGAKDCFAIFGNYHRIFPGRYRATFYTCQVGSSVSLVDVSQAVAQATLGGKAIPNVPSLSECRPLPAVVVKYDTSRYPFSPVEHRVYYGGEGVIYFDRVEVEALR